MDDSDDRLLLTANSSLEVFGSGLQQTIGEARLALPDVLPEHYGKLQFGQTGRSITCRNIVEGGTRQAPRPGGALPAFGGIDSEMIAGLIDEYGFEGCDNTLARSSNCGQRSGNSDPDRIRGNEAAAASLGIGIRRGGQTVCAATAASKTATCGMIVPQNRGLRLKRRFQAMTEPGVWFSRPRTVSSAQLNGRMLECFCCLPCTGSSPSSDQCHFPVRGSRSCLTLRASAFRHRIGSEAA